MAVYRVRNLGVSTRRVFLWLLSRDASNSRFLFFEHLTGEEQILQHAAKLNCEGIVSKRADAP